MKLAGSLLFSFILCVFFPFKCHILYFLKLILLSSVTIFLKQFLQGKFHYLFLWNDTLHMFLLATQGMASSTQLKLCKLTFINMLLIIFNYYALFT